MADWSNNNRACTTLWAELHNMQQLSNNFDDSGKLQMKDLLFYNSLSSAELRESQAVTIADHLDNFFRLVLKAPYETDIDRTSAIHKMVGILIDGSKYVSDLASTVDDSYKFLGE
jgi:hypothetical protein